jgi:hypothetical protein
MMCVNLLATASTAPKLSFLIGSCLRRAALAPYRHGPPPGPAAKWLGAGSATRVANLADAFTRMSLHHPMRRRPSLLVF